MANIGLGSSLDSKLDDLDEFFSRDPRFEFVGLIATGSYGFTTRVRIRHPAVPGLRSFVVKRAIGGKDARTNLATEKRFLTVCTFENEVSEMIKELIIVTKYTRDCKIICI